jgi:hypothetical protein
VGIVDFGSQLGSPPYFCAAGVAALA